MNMKLIWWILIAILQCTLDKDLNDSITNEKSKVVILFKNNGDLPKFIYCNDIFEQSILENETLLNRTWIGPGLCEMCKTDLYLNIPTIDSHLMNYHDYFLKNVLVTVTRFSINNLESDSLSNGILIVINLSEKFGQSDLERASFDFLEIYIKNINGPKVLLYKYHFNEITNVIINRSRTRSFINTNSVFNIHNTIFVPINCNSNLNYNVKVNFVYLGERISKLKYSIHNNVITLSKYIGPKSALLIITLLLMCGDTGTSINPGPISFNDVQTNDEFIDERYLSYIDPDKNYYNDGEIETTYFRSYTADEFKEKDFGTSNCFNIMHHNCRSILSKDKLDNYGYFLDLLGDPFDIIGFSETWLNDDNVSLPIFKDYKYNHVYATRPLDRDIANKDRGGGLSLLIRDNISFKQRNDISIMTPYMELLFVEINFNNKKYLIGVTYRIPDTNIKSFIDGINTILEPLNNSHQIIIMGDFNICLLKENNHTKDFRNIMQSNSLFPTIFEPTRVALVIRDEQPVVTKSLIDNIFVNDNVNYNSGIIFSGISDHYPIFISIPCNLTNVNFGNLEIKYRLIDDYRIRKSKSALANNSIIQTITLMESAETAFTTFFNIFNQIYDKYFPIIIKNVTKKSLQKPWITNSMTEKIKRKHYLAKSANTGKIDKKIYSDFRNNLTKELREAKAKYYNNEFSKNKGDIRGTWKIINKNIKKKLNLINW